MGKMFFPGEGEKFPLPSAFYFCGLFVLFEPFAWVPVKWLLNFIWEWLIQGYRSTERLEIYGLVANPPILHYAWYDEIIYCLVVGFVAWATVLLGPSKNDFDEAPPLGKGDKRATKWCLIFWGSYVFANPICFIPCFIVTWFVAISDKNAFYNTFTAIIASCAFIPACVLSLIIMYRVIVQVKSFVFQRIACTMLCMPILILIGIVKMTFLFGWAGFPRFLMWVIFHK